MMVLSRMKSVKQTCGEFMNDFTEKPHKVMGDAILVKGLKQTLETSHSEDGL